MRAEGRRKQHLDGSIGCYGRIAPLHLSAPDDATEEEGDPPAWCLSADRSPHPTVRVSEPEEAREVAQRRLRGVGNSLGASAWRRPCSAGTASRMPIPHAGTGSRQRGKA